jgi:putative ABC transport system permease protein
LQLYDLLRVSVRQVVRHRRRYLGVVLAIALGVAGFITVITMSREVKKNFNEDLDLIGGVTVVRLYFDNQRSYRPQWFRENTLAALSRLPGVKEVSLSAVKWGLTTYHGERHGFTIMGVDDAFWRVRAYWPLTGSLFGAEAVAKRQREVVLGAELARKIYGRQDLRGQVIEINHEFYRIAGVLGGVTDSGMANAAFLPLTTAQDRLPGVVLADRAYIRCASWDDVLDVTAAIPQVVKAHQSPEELHVEISREGLKRVKQLAWWIEFLIYLAISATFILGGVGIWNVMMAAVTSRTREIGLKKAMGAEDRDILVQFLAEALCLCIGAALMGGVLGRLLTEGLGRYINSRPSEPLFLLGLAMAFAFALVLGVTAGLYPSLRASRMEVVTAIRYE